MYDFIIIGAGSAGCVLANRLSANPDHSVCLIEAGGSDKNYLVRNTNPLNMLMLMKSRQYNWGYKCQPESRTGNRQFFWPRGKVLGGSSSINAMIYTRGHPWDFDHWAQIGNQGWSYKDVLPWFKKSQRWSRGANYYHDNQGTMDVVDTNFHFPTSKAFVNACDEAGFRISNDFNGAQQEGCGFFQVTQTPSGHRANSAYSFLDDVLERKNLTVLSNAHVTKVIFNGKRATGVEISRGANKGKFEQILASKEVILSAGVINTPQILKLSGIGSASELAHHNIPLIHELLGVGENLQDHPDVIVRFLSKAGGALTTSFSLDTLQFFKKVLFSKDFIYTPTDAGGFIKSSPDEPIPDLQLQFGAVRMQPHGEGLFTSMKSGYVLHVCHLRPESRGKVKLASKDPFVAPIIEANYFEKEKELNALVKGVKLCRNILNQPALAKFNGGEELPGIDVQTDEQIKNWIKHHVETVYHTAGSCKMGNDKMAVVNTDLQVHGVTGLRVIDASIMPTITGSNIHAPTVMIAEKGADKILQLWR
ncbi:GMC family oxidoreductase [Thalassotalea piscium]|uniref:Choline dehydrogenase-like flavoprotein n=1 Tax=Thalassotalea piscium TaxID=1230533 RepID=A0A7X0NK21_9GAMM|nr:GMC family oxidoreductase N-terminal domain-containing protein [Thalassotalea piscium]MBB6544902.1 choline dehydrogenase-like flavoprotein [Thalassotalea piscium]